MKTSFLATLAFAGLSLCAAPLLRAQNANSLLPSTGPGQSNGTFVVNSINVSTPKTPEYNTQAGDATTKKYTLGSWLEVEVDFGSGAPASEVNLHYSILIGGRMLVGDQTLVEVPAGRNLFTVVFVSPRTLTTLLKGAPLTPAAIQNIDVQILRPGVSQPIANKMLKEGPAFYTTLQQVPGSTRARPRSPCSGTTITRRSRTRPPVVKASQPLAGRAWKIPILSAPVCPTRSPASFPFCRLLPPDSSPWPFPLASLP